MRSLFSLRAGRTARALCLLTAFTPLAQANDLASLDPLVITATMSETTLSDVPASVTVIDRESLERRPIQDLADALRGSPGVDLSSVGLTRRGIRIRGMDSDYTLTLINGRRINAASDAIAHADFDLGWLPMAAVERIEVVRGPMSSLYGSEALGGVVNLITRSATDEWKGSAHLNGGFVDNGRGGDNQQAAVYVAGPLIKDRLGLSLYGENRRRQEIIDLTDKRLSEQEGRTAESGGLTLSFTPDQAQRLDFDWLQGDEKRRRNALESGRTPYYYRSNDHIERRQLSLTHKGEWQWGDSLLRGYRSTLEKNNRRSVGAASRTQKLTDDTLDGHISVHLGDFQRLTSGGEWRREHLEDSTVSRKGEAELIHRALFVQDEIKLTDNGSLTLGNRADHHQQFGWHHSPRLYSLWHLPMGLRLKGGIAKGFKAPTLKQLSPEYSAIGGGGGFTIIGNPHLKPETVTSYELGLNWQGEKRSSGITLFQNDLKNLIQTLCVADCGRRGPSQRREYTNINRARLRGVELAGETTLPLNFSLQGNYTWLAAEDRQSGQRLTERPRHRGATTLAWQPAQAFHAALRSEYNGSQEVNASALRRRVTLPAYWLHSLNLSYQISENLNLRGSVENLTDKTLYDDSALYPFAEIGRAYNLSFTFNF
ncbi:TonB-dependent receptor [Ventosimonas gracilis]|uniref:TonB-dependent receptor n=1 Tax=Ventosimonas gracilis TaxID=1680762 RepID=A0A139SIQ5_9GAMM|nr:TonB-dependent receptor [Ventosimonas gracilis]KXU34455.1 TonB-dependent receptor [Ventosimonas gracilis]